MSAETLASFKARTDEITTREHFPGTGLSWALCQTRRKNTRFVVTALSSNSSDGHVGSFARLWASSIAGMKFSEADVVVYGLSRLGIENVVKELRPVVEASPDKPHLNFKAALQLLNEGAARTLIVCKDEDLTITQAVQAYQDFLNRNR